MERESFEKYCKIACMERERELWIYGTVFSNLFILRKKEKEEK